MMCKDAVVLNCGHTVCVYCSLDVCIQCRAPVKSRVPNRQIRRIIDTYQTDELCCRCDEDVCDWSVFEDSKDSESEKRFIATVAWEDGSRIKFGLTGNTYDGLVVLLDLWAAGTLAKTAQKANPLKLVLEDTDLPFAEL
ncbi:hypothetical protein, partial [Salmonella enterica]|uniref:hypothetical protein n=1 Tax=Salmonella enterica TaxID=28901 RepID=UPI0011BEC994